MKILGLVFATACIAATVSVSDAAEEDRSERNAALMVSRNADGEIRGAAAAALRRLVRIANQQQEVRVWVTLNVPFDPYLADYSPEAAAAQDRRLNRVFDNVLNPLLNRGNVWYPDGVRDFRGPSLVLHASAAGVRQLAKDRRVGQIVGVQPDQ